MSLKLIIAEKPSVASDVAKALEGPGSHFVRTDFGFASNEYLVTSAAGHLVAELNPEEYDAKYKTWSYSHLPIIPDVFKHAPRDTRAKDRLKMLVALIARPDVSAIINACDAGREGEHIFKLIIQFARQTNPKPIFRAWFASMTPEAIQGAFSNLRPDAVMVPLEYAARCRAEADWLIGMNATRAATTTLGGGSILLSIGRVQTPTLAMIINRDLEIDAFSSKTFHTITANFATTSPDAELYAARWFKLEGDAKLERFESRQEALDLAARVETASAHVVSVETTSETKAPPKLFDLTSLQRQANKLYGLSATKTLEAAQACYETHKVLSYPRTDSAYISSDMASVVPLLLARVGAASSELEVFTSQALALLDLPVARIIKDAAITDHHAIIPTNAPHNLAALSKDEARIYDLVARRFIAALLPPQRGERTTVITQAATTQGPETFQTNAVVVIDPGWMITLANPAGSDPDEDTDDEVVVNQLPVLVVDQVVDNQDCVVKEGKTTAPARHTEASLLAGMASAGRTLTDQQATDEMRELGLGTPATRASIIETLLKREYISRKGRQLMGTDKGRGLILALGTHKLTRADLTGEWERRLRLVEHAKPEEADRYRAAFAKKIKEYTAEVVADFANATQDQLLAGRRVIAPCPAVECSGSVIDARRSYACNSYKSKEEKGCGFVVWKESEGKKVTEKQLMAKIEDVKAGRVIILKPVAREVLGPCPRCPGEIVARVKSWGCSSYHSPQDPGCGYTIWKTTAQGLEVGLTEAKAMLARGETNGRAPAKVFRECPVCSGQIVEREKNWSCNSYRGPAAKGCGTTIWKTGKAGQETTREEALLQLSFIEGSQPPRKKRSTKAAK